MIWRRYVVIGVFGLLLGGMAVVSQSVGGVRAFDLQTTDTVTASITAPAFNGGVVTVTSQPSISDTSCPSGLPSGWGTVTPGPLWSAMCIQCAAAKALATGTPTAGPTDGPITQTVAALTATSTITPTATPAPTATTAAGVLTWVGISHPTCGYAYAAPWYSYTESQYSTSGLRLDYQSRGGGVNNCVASNFTFSDSRGSGNKTYTVVADTYSSGGFLFNWFYSYPTQYQLQVGNQGIGYKHWSYSYTWDQRYISLSHASSSAMGSWVTGGTWYIWPGSGLPPTPNAVPTSTPNPSSYCATVQSEGLSDSGFSYSGIGFGSMSCFDIGPLDWSSILPSWLAGSFPLPNFPWLAHICLQDIDIGGVTLFGLYVPFLTGVYAMGVVLCIRIITRK